MPACDTNIRCMHIFHFDVTYDELLECGGYLLDVALLGVLAVRVLCALGIDRTNEVVQDGRGRHASVACLHVQRLEAVLERRLEGGPRRAGVSRVDDARRFRQIDFRGLDEGLEGFKESVGARGVGEHRCVSFPGRLKHLSARIDELDSVVLRRSLRSDRAFYDKRKGDSRPLGYGSR